MYSLPNVWFDQQCRKLCALYLFIFYIWPKTWTLSDCSRLFNSLQEKLLTNVICFTLAHVLWHYCYTRVWVRYRKVHKLFPSFSTRSLDWLTVCQSKNTKLRATYARSDKLKVHTKPADSSKERCSPEGTHQTFPAVNNTDNQMHNVNLWSCDNKPDTYKRALTVECRALVTYDARLSTVYDKEQAVIQYGS